MIQRREKEETLHRNEWRFGLCLFSYKYKLERIGRKTYLGADKAKANVEDLDEGERHDGMEVGEGRVREGDFTKGFENGKGNDSKNALSERNEKPRRKSERCECIFERNLERMRRGGEFASGEGNVEREASVW